jgi:hypothetical protein
MGRFIRAAGNPTINLKIREDRCSVTVAILIGILVCDHAESPMGEALGRSTIGAIMEMCR